MSESFLLLFFKKEVLLLPCLAACSTVNPVVALAPDTGAAAQALNVTTAQNCPWPAGVAQFAQTTLIARHPGARPPNLGILHGVAGGCAVLRFTLYDSGIVSGSQILAETPPGFGATAEKVLRWNDYATGNAEDTVFVVRLGAAGLADGGAMLSLGFIDRTINLVVPASAGATHLVSPASAGS